MKMIRSTVSGFFIAFLFSLVWVVSCVAEETAGEVYIKAGEHLYNQNCVFCHQADAIGKPGMAPSLINKELLSTASDKFFLTTIRDGRPGTGMPPFAHLEEGRIKAIIAFIRSHSQLPNKAVEIDSQPAPTVIPDWGNSGLDKFVRLVMARKAMVMLQVVRVPRNEIICTQNNNFATSKAIK